MDISFLRERSDNTFTVSEINQIIKGMFESNHILSSVNIRGEISNFVNHRSGHLYFSLKDEEGQIRAVMFRSSAVKLKFIPENGMKVTVFGTITAFPRDGSYQIYVASIQPDGIGALYMAYEQLKSRLENEGLFSYENKKPIPDFPSKIGVITSPTGAAVRDIINVLGRRYPLAEIYLYPALVQGEDAPRSLIDGIDYFDATGFVDTVIIGRGGGSLEDLWAFNNEALARRIFDCKIPVISAVGHETDFTICDFVADLRAPTPSAAAELSVPDIRELMLRLDNISDRCDRSLRLCFDRKKERMLVFTDRLEYAEPTKVISDKKRVLLEKLKDLDNLYSKKISENRYLLERHCEKLDALNPISVLLRGYSAVRNGKNLVSRLADAHIGDMVQIRTYDGSFDARIEGKTNLKTE